jgi:TolB-like protein
LSAGAALRGAGKARIIALPRCGVDAIAPAPGRATWRIVAGRIDICGWLLAYPRKEGRAAMAAAAETRPDLPDPSDVRAQVERMAVSDVLRTSPQLVSFLRFVVDAELSGRSNRIKGYTIAVEVLRRDPRFDPRIDPIVRVEAGRLRRAIDRYYRGPGADDAIVIDLPRGGYVPTFRRRDVDAPPPRAAAGPRRWPDMWLDLRASRHLAVLAAVITIAVAVGLLVAPRLREQPATGNAPERPAASATEARSVGNGMPVLSIEAFDVAGTPAPRSVLAASLRERIGDAFSRFDLVNIMSDAQLGTGAGAPGGPARHPDYRFGGSLAYDAEGTARISFRVVDAADGNVIWSQVFERVATAQDRAAAEEAIVRQLAPALLQPFGVIFADGRRKALAGDAGDPRYRCILDAAESFRSFDAAEQLRARACLEALTETDSSFAIGFSYLAAVYLREYQYGLGARGGDPPPLDRALRAARRGVELNPAGARAYEMMFVVLFARGDLPAAFASGDKAMTLNPYDARLRGSYGARLIANGEIDKGVDMLAQVAADGSILPAFEQFFLFLGSYLRDDVARAAAQAGQITGDTFQLGLVARALVASANGDREAAARAGERLIALNPAWHDDLRGELARFFAADAIIDRLARDLSAAGVGRS